MFQIVFQDMPVYSEDQISGTELPPEIIAVLSW